MTSNISSNAAFVVLMSDPKGVHIRDYDTIAQGLSIKEDASHAEGVWGTAAWFDKVAANMRMIAIKTPPHIEQNSYRVRDLYGDEYTFQLITKPVYDSIVRRLVPHAPELLSDKEAQDYVSGLNPYQ